MSSSHWTSLIPPNFPEQREVEAGPCPLSGEQVALRKNGVQTRSPPLAPDITDDTRPTEIGKIESLLKSTPSLRRSDASLLTNVPQQADATSLDKSTAGQLREDERQRRRPRCKSASFPDVGSRARTRRRRAIAVQESPENPSPGRTAGSAATAEPGRRRGEDSSNTDTTSSTSSQYHREGADGRGGFLSAICGGLSNLLRAAGQGHAWRVAAAADPAAVSHIARAKRCCRGFGPCRVSQRDVLVLPKSDTVQSPCCPSHCSASRRQELFGSAAVRLGTSSGSSNEQAGDDEHVYVGRAIQTHDLGHWRRCRNGYYNGGYPLRESIMRSGCSRSLSPGSRRCKHRHRAKMVNPCSGDLIRIHENGVGSPRKWPVPAPPSWLVGTPEPRDRRVSDSPSFYAYPQLPLASWDNTPPAQAPRANLSWDPDRVSFGAQPPGETPTTVPTTTLRAGPIRCGRCGGLQPGAGATVVDCGFASDPPIRDATVAEPPRCQKCGGRVLAAGLPPVSPGPSSNCGPIVMRAQPTPRHFDDSNIHVGAKGTWPLSQGPTGTVAALAATPRDATGDGYYYSVQPLQAKSERCLEPLELGGTPPVPVNVHASRSAAGGEARRYETARSSPCNTRIEVRVAPSRKNDDGDRFDPSTFTGVELSPQREKSFSSSTRVGHEMCRHHPVEAWCSVEQPAQAHDRVALVRLEPNDRMCHNSSRKAASKKFRLRNALEAGHRQTSSTCTAGRPLSQHDCVKGDSKTPALLSSGKSLHIDTVCVEATASPRGLANGRESSFAPGIHVSPAISTASLLDSPLTSAPQVTGIDTQNVSWMAAQPRNLEPHSHCPSRRRFNLSRRRPPARPRRNRALCVGVACPGAVCESNAAVADATAFHACLGHSPFNFPSRRLLVDSKCNLASCVLESRIPTKVNVLAGLRWLLNGCGPGDVLVWYFAGASSRIPNTPAAKVGTDAFMTSRNSRSLDKRPGEEAVLYSDEVHDILKEFLQPGTIFVCFFDTTFCSTMVPLSSGFRQGLGDHLELCHRVNLPKLLVKTIAESTLCLQQRLSKAKIRCRDIGADYLTKPYYETSFSGFSDNTVTIPAANLFDDEVGSPTLRGSPVVFVFEATDGERESAVEAIIAGHPHGVFTHCLLEALHDFAASLHPGYTMLDLFEQCCDALTRLREQAAGDVGQLKRQRFRLSFLQSRPPFAFAVLSDSAPDLSGEQAERLGREPACVAIRSTSRPRRGILVAHESGCDTDRDEVTARARARRRLGLGFATGTTTDPDPLRIRVITVVLQSVDAIINDCAPSNLYYVTVALLLRNRTAGVSVGQEGRSAVVWGRADPSNKKFEVCDFQQQRVVLKAHPFELSSGLRVALWHRCLPLSSSVQRPRVCNYVDRKVAEATMDLHDRLLRSNRPWVLRSPDQATPVAVLTFRVVHSEARYPSEVVGRRRAIRLIGSNSRDTRSLHNHCATMWQHGTSNDRGAPSSPPVRYTNCPGADSSATVQELTTIGESPSSTPSVATAEVGLSAPPSKRFAATHMGQSDGATLVRSTTRGPGTKRAAVVAVQSQRPKQERNAPTIQGRSSAAVEEACKHYYVISTPPTSG